MLVSDAIKILIGVVFGVLIGVYLPHLDGGNNDNIINSNVVSSQLRQPAARNLLEAAPVALSPDRIQNHSESDNDISTTRGDEIQQVRGDERLSVLNHDDHTNAAAVALQPGTERKLVVDKLVNEVEGLVNNVKSEVNNVISKAKNIHGEVNKLGNIVAEDGPIHKAIKDIVDVENIANSIVDGAVNVLKEIDFLGTASKLAKELEKAMKDFFTQEFCVPYDCIVDKVLEGLKKMSSYVKSSGGKKKSARGSRKRRSGRLKKKNNRNDVNTGRKLEGVDLDEIVLLDSDLFTVSTALEPVSCLQIEDIQFDVPKLKDFLDLFKNLEDLDEIFRKLGDYLREEVELIDDVADEAERFLKTVEPHITKIKTTIESGANTVKNTGTRIVGELGQIDDKIADVASAAFNQGKEWAKNAAKDTGNWGSNAAKDTGNWGSNAAKDTANWGSNAVKDTGKFFGFGKRRHQRRLVRTKSGREIPVEQLRAEVYEKGRRRLEELYAEHINRVFEERNLRENARLYIGIKKLTMILSANFGQTVWMGSQGRAGYTGTIFDDSVDWYKQYPLPYTAGMVRVSTEGSFQGAMTYGFSMEGAADLEFDYNVGEAKMQIDVVQGKVTLLKDPFQTNLQANASLTASGFMDLSLNAAANVALCLGAGDNGCVTVAIDFKQKAAAGFDAMASAMIGVGFEEGKGIEKKDALSATPLTPMFADDLVEYGSESTCDDDLSLSAGYWQYLTKPEVTVSLTVGGGCATSETTLLETEPGIMQSTSDSFCFGASVDSSDVVDSEAAGSGTAVTGLSPSLKTVKPPGSNSQLWEGPFDIDGDGKEDLVASSGDKIYYSLSGESGWQDFDLPNPADMFDSKFADFDHDGKTDALRIKNNELVVSSGMTGEWKALNEKCAAPENYQFDMRELGVGYFTKDGLASVLLARQGTGQDKVQLCSSQTNGWVTIIHSTYSVDRMTFADVNGDNRDDIVVWTQEGWTAALSKASGGHTWIKNLVKKDVSMDFKRTKMGRDAEGKPFVLYEDNGDIYRVDLSAGPGGKPVTETTTIASDLTVLKTMGIISGLTDIALADFAGNGVSEYFDVSQICVKEATRYGSSCLNPLPNRRQGMVNGRFCDDARIFEGNLLWGDRLKCKDKPVFGKASEGSSCGQGDKKAYCSYDIESDACAYCAN